MNKITNKQNIYDWSKVPEEILEDFGEEGDFYRKYLLNPSLFKLLGNIKDRKILDAGCGQGYLSRLMAKMGAKVTGIEPAENSYKYCLKKESEETLGIEYLQQDLSELSEMENSFDVVVSNMVLMDIPDWETAIKNCIKVLKPGGFFIFSISHPCFEDNGGWEENKFITVAEYFEEYQTKPLYGHSFHRTLSTYMNFLIQEGCQIEEIIEPQLPEEILKEFPERNKNYHIPGFIIIKVGKHE